MFVSTGNPNAKGAIAELKIATAATCLGVPVLRPMTERGRYDEIGGRLLRVQCKWANVRGEALVVHLRSYLTKTREVRSVYSAGESTPLRPTARSWSAVICCRRS